MADYKSEVMGVHYFSIVMSHYNLEVVCQLCAVVSTEVAENVLGIDSGMVSEIGNVGRTRVRLG